MIRARPAQSASHLLARSLAEQAERERVEAEAARAARTPPPKPRPKPVAATTTDPSPPLRDPSRKHWQDLDADALNRF
ncbi:hypothetical protein [Agromyces salentinus]|uniref:Uncharacterized protein n=1 Tax=Agromyces salentinus TaxID=269421 RepID=A0ABN2MNH4_9MICO|nr:hypothetical protein [Agromyces salentinus]